MWRNKTASPSLRSSVGVLLTHWVSVSETQYRGPAVHGRLVCASGVAVLGRADRHGTEAQGASDILEQRPGGDDHFQRHVHACSPRCVFMYVDNFKLREQDDEERCVEEREG